MGPWGSIHMFCLFVGSVACSLLICSPHKLIWAMCTYVYIYSRFPHDPQLLCFEASAAKLPRSLEFPNVQPLHPRFPNFQPQGSRFPNLKPQGSRCPNFKPQGPKFPKFKISCPKGLDFKFQNFKTSKSWKFEIWKSRASGLEI